MPVMRAVICQFSSSDSRVNDYAYLVAETSGEAMNDVQVRPGIFVPLVVRFACLSIIPLNR